MNEKSKLGPEDDKILSVIYNRKPLLTYKSVLDYLGIQDNQHVTEQQFWDIIRLNAERDIAIVKLFTELKNQEN